MLYISVAYNVISCKKNKKKHTRATKIADFTMYIWLPSTEMSENSLKNVFLNRNLLNSFLLFWPYRATDFMM